MSSAATWTQRSAPGHPPAHGGPSGCALRRAPWRWQKHDHGRLRRHAGITSLPFGHGLSYTTWERSDLAVEASTTSDDARRSVSPSPIPAIGPGTDVVQVFFRDEVATVGLPGFPGCSAFNEWSCTRVPRLVCLPCSGGSVWGSRGPTCDTEWNPANSPSWWATWSETATRVRGRRLPRAECRSSGDLQLGIQADGRTSRGARPQMGPGSSRNRERPDLTRNVVPTDVMPTTGCSDPMPPGRAEERGVSVVEDATIGRSQPVALAVGVALIPTTGLFSLSPAADPY